MLSTSRAFVALATVSVVLFAVLQACSTGDGKANNAGQGGSIIGGGGSSVGGDNLGGFNSGGNATGGSGGGCAEVASAATEGLAPADIIIAVDTSGSMDDEAGWTQQNMNAMVTAIVNSGIDAHVVMISSDEICVPAPLGSGSCPADENLPGYRHVMQNVESHDALVQIINTYSQWQGSMRPTASKTIVVISDDDSDDMSAADFTTALIGLDSAFQGFKFDAIVSYQDPGECTTACAISLCTNCGKCCPLCMAISASEGSVYLDLVLQTNGVKGDLCDQNFAPVFQDMATAVVTSSKIECVYDIPDPGGGETIDFDKVNVDYKADPNDPPQPIYYVPGGLAACGPNGGWYYDDPNDPTQIIFCPTTCDAVQTSTDGEVTVKFGCETLTAPPA